ncbi:galactoside 2-alpha-L-fucosyltransferase 2-like [Argonauta hians]
METRKSLAIDWSNSKSKTWFYTLCILTIGLILIYMIVYINTNQGFKRYIFTNVSQNENNFTSLSPGLMIKIFSSTAAVTTSSKPALKKKSKKYLYICVGLSGRLGNQMFEIASALGIAKHKNMSAYIKNNIKYLRDIFHIHGFEEKKISCKNFRTVYEQKASSFDPKLFNISRNNVTVSGYLQSYKYFEHIYDNILSQFSFKEKVKGKAERILKNIYENHKNKTNITQNMIKVGIHVRRGDMVNNNHGYQVASKEYFIKAKKWFQSRYKNVIFVVCSNDIAWCENNISDNNTYFIKGNSPGEDMAILSYCDHLISSVGSYSWWSGFLSKGNVTYYFPPAKNNSPLRTQYSKDYMDYFLPKWIRI